MHLVTFEPLQVNFLSHYPQICRNHFQNRKKHRCPGLFEFHRYLFSILLGEFFPAFSPGHAYEADL